MEKKVLINLYGKDIAVVIHNSLNFLKTSRYSYGQIYIGCPIDAKIEDIKKYLQRTYNKKTIDKFSDEPLYGQDYCYILGEKRRIIRPFSQVIPSRGDIIIENDEELQIKLNKLSLDIISSRVKYYEKIMNTKEHSVKITNMYAARGKNYFKKNVLTFARELIHFSLELIDAIVVHELSHDFEQNHYKSFYKVVEKYCDNYYLKIEKITYGVKK